MSTRTNPEYLMAGPLVETKLLPPRLRAGAVPRARLDELLRRGSQARLTLVSAPAGFGKTSLLTGWLAGQGKRPLTAWVSLDERDRDATTFWTYLLEAIDRAVPGSATVGLVRPSSRPAAVESMLTGLVNELSVLPDDLTLVLDDYHLAESPTIQQGVAFLLDHLPPQVHMVISTRADPALPLSRLRALGDLVEIRAPDLRFTSSETAAYLHDSCGLDLDATEVAALEARTEGWVAALQLAALSLSEHEDQSGFIAGFAGDDRYVVDYLADEVLNRQPEELRRFLLETSVLDQMTASLCDAVTGRDDAAATLESLERQNLFLVPLDRHRRWYRYHHLFADVLKARLVDETPGDVPALHRRASDWLHRAGDPEAAVRHALAGGDAALAAERVELAIPAMRRERREGEIRRWIDQVPADMVATRPVLAAGFIGGLMASNEFEGVDRRLREVEQLLAAPSVDMVVTDQAEFERLPAALEAYRAALCLVDGDVTGAVEHADVALKHAATDDHLSIASASAVSGLASWTNGDLDAAHHGYRVASDHLSRAGYVADVVGCATTLADIEMTQGKLGAAQRTFEGALVLARGEAAPPRGTADMYVGLSQVAYERGDLPGAADFLRRADELGDAAGLPKNPHRWRVAMALLREAEGDPQTAIALLDEAERVFVADFAPDVRPIPATRARILAASGDVAGALAWTRRSGLSADDHLSYLREYGHVTLARVLLTDSMVSPTANHLSQTTELLGRLRVAAERGGRIGTLIEVLVLQALAQASTGQPDRALASLDVAVRRAEPEGQIRAFIGLGRPLEGPLIAVLNRLVSIHANSSYAARLLQTAAGEQSGARPTASTAQPLVDPLSGRELDVLRLLRSDLDGPSIARELGVSLATVRTHTQHIYAKLGVTSRRAAVRRAHQLNLYSRRPRP